MRVTVQKNWAKLVQFLVIVIGLLLGISSITWSVDEKSESPAEKSGLVIRLSRDTLNFIADGETLTCIPNGVLVDSTGLFLKNRLLIDRQGFHLAGRTIDPAGISTIVIQKKPNSYLTKTPTDDDQFAFFQKLPIRADDFVRGDLYLFGGTANIAGEVSGDIIALFGNVDLYSSAVVRGDILAIGGDVFQQEGATVYGEIRQGGLIKTVRHTAKKPWRREITLKVKGTRLDFAYNRVDGLVLMPYFVLKGKVSGYPSLHLGAGRAFERNRYFYDLGFQQELFPTNSLFGGASLYRLTTTDDEWIMSTGENNVSTILVRRDFRDYVEKEGVNFFVGQKLTSQHTFRLDYYFDQYRRLDNQSNWSVFGPKYFRKNFSAVPESLRIFYNSDLNSEAGTAIFSYTYDTRNDPDDPTQGWYNRLAVEHAGPDLGGDLFYTRFRVTVQRYQTLTVDQHIYFRMVYGNSSERLPLQKLYYVGGIGTLRGYLFKEFVGDQFGLLNVDYAIKFPKTSLEGIVLFDLGKATFEKNLFDATPWKTDLGVGIRLGSVIRFDLAKGLDDLERPLVLTARFRRMF